MKIRTETLESAHKFFLFAALLAPALFMPWLAYPFIFGKTAYFMLAVALMSVPFTALLARGAVRPKLPAFLSFLFLYYAVLGVATIFGFDPARSFWAEAVRMTGMVTHLFLLAFLIMLITGVRSEVAWHRIFVFSAFVGLIVIVGALMEFVFPGVRRLLGTAESARISGVIGNPIFLGMYLIPIAGIMVYLATRTKGIGARIGWIVAALSASVTIFLTGSRAAAGGLIVGIFTGLVALLFVAHKRSRTRIIVDIILLLFLAFGVAAYGASKTKFAERVPALKRLTSFSFNEFGPRRLNWEIALEGIKARPLLGWGPENSLYVFDRYYRPELLRYGISEASSDKPHNGILEVAVAGGIGALALFLGFWGWVIALLGRVARRSVIPPTLFSIGAGIFTGYLFSLFFAFDTPASLITLFTFLAYVVYRLTPASPRESAAPTALYATFGALVSALLLGIVGYGILRPFPAFTAGQRALEANGRDPAVWTDAYRTVAVSHNPYSVGLIREFTRDFILWEGRGTLPEKMVSMALPIVISATDDAIRREPENFILQYERGQIALIAKEYKTAESAFMRATELSPRRQAPIFMRAKVMLLTGRGSEAVSLLKSIVKADHAVGQAHWFYGLALLETGSRAEGIKELEESVREGRGMTVREKLYLVDLYAKDKNFEKIVKIYEEIISNDPLRAEWHTRLAATYAALGKNELAIIEAMRAAELDPNFERFRDEFIQKLPKQ